MKQIYLTLLTSSFALVICLFLLQPLSAYAHYAGHKHSHANNRVTTQPVSNRMLIPRPINRSTVIIAPQWRSHNYNAGAALIAGIALGTVIANANDISPSTVHQFTENDITYFIVNGQRCVLVDGQFVAIK